MQTGGIIHAGTRHYAITDRDRRGRSILLTSPFTEQAISFIVPRRFGIAECAKTPELKPSDIINGVTKRKYVANQFFGILLGISLVANGGASPLNACRAYSASATLR